MLFLGATKYIDELQHEVIHNHNQINSMQLSVQSETENLQSEVKDTFNFVIRSYREIMKKNLEAPSC